MACSKPSSLSITNSWSLLKLMSIESDEQSLFHPLSSSSPPTFNLSQHQGLFQRVSSLNHVAKDLEFQLQHHPSNEYSGLVGFPLGLTGWISLQSKGLSRVFSSTTVQKHQFHYGLTLTSLHDYGKNHSIDKMDLCQQSNVSAFSLIDV